MTLTNEEVMERYGFAICPTCNADMPAEHSCGDDLEEESHEQEVRGR